MIKYDTKVWFRHIVNFHKADTIRALFWEMMIVAIYTAGMSVLELEYLKLSDDSILSNTTVVHSILGFVLSLLLVFRTNTAYDRWWEGRKHWGALVNNTRNLAIKINSMLPEDAEEDRKFFKKIIPNFPFALKEHLRSGVLEEEIDDVDGLKGSWFKKVHVPNQIIQSIYRRIKTLYKKGDITGDELIILDKELKSFTDIMGACERIRHTPIPYSYNIFLKKFIFFYILTIPLGFIVTFHYWAIPICVFVFYVLVSLEIIAEEIEDPFGHDANDLPTQELSAKIKNNVEEIFEG